MSESLVGLATPTTRQKATTGKGLPGASAAASGVNIPAGTSWADVIVISVNERLVRLGHEEAAQAAELAAQAIARKAFPILLPLPDNLYGELDLPGSGCGRVDCA